MMSMCKTLFQEGHAGVMIYSQFGMALASSPWHGVVVGHMLTVRKEPGSLIYRTSRYPYTLLVIRSSFDYNGFQNNISTITSLCLTPFPSMLKHRKPPEMTTTAHQIIACSLILYIAPFPLFSLPYVGHTSGCRQSSDHRSSRIEADGLEGAGPDEGSKQSRSSLRGPRGHQTATNEAEYWRRRNRTQASWTIPRAASEPRRRSPAPPKVTPTDPPSFPSLPPSHSPLSSVSAPIGRAVLHRRICYLIYCLALHWSPDVFELATFVHSLFSICIVFLTPWGSLQGPILISPGSNNRPSSALEDF